MKDARTPLSIELKKIKKEKKQICFYCENIYRKSFVHIKDYFEKYHCFEKYNFKNF